LAVDLGGNFACPLILTSQLGKISPVTLIVLLNYPQGIKKVQSRGFGPIHYSHDNYLSPFTRYKLMFANQLTIEIWRKLHYNIISIKINRNEVSIRSQLIINSTINNYLKVIDIKT